MAISKELPMFIPDYNNIAKAAKNEKSVRIPLYEHIVSPLIMETILGKKFADLGNGGYEDKKEFFRHYNRFFTEMGYDTISWECCVGAVMPGSGSLGRHVKGVIQNRKDFEAYPWDSIPDMYFRRYGDYFKALGETMPEGTRGIGGVGNGVFECVQDITGFENLCYIKVDDGELYQGLFNKVGEMLASIWERFLKEYGGLYCVCRTGDDFGFK